MANTVEVQVMVVMDWEKEGFKSANEAVDQIELDVLHRFPGKVYINKISSYEGRKLWQSFTFKRPVRFARKG